MFRLGFITVEDQEPARPFNEIYSRLSKSPLIARGIVEADPARARLVTSYLDFLSALAEMNEEGYDLLFITVDLEIPEGPGSTEANSRYGRKVVSECRRRIARGEPISFCVITGYPEELPDMGDVAFAIKGHPSDFDKLASQALYDLTQRVPAVSVQFSGRSFEVMLAGDATGEYRRLFLHRAEQIANGTVPMLPVLLVGDEGAGPGAWVAHLQQLLDADLAVVDLSQGLSTPQQLLHLVKTQAQPQDTGKPRIVYWTRLDQMKAPAASQEQVLRHLMKVVRLQVDSGGPGRATRDLHVFQINWTRRLSLGTFGLRQFVDEIENLICASSGVALASHPTNSLGYVEDLSRIIVLPTLRSCGRSYIRRLLESRLAASGAGIRLDEEFADALVRDVEWDTCGGIAGVYEAVDRIVARCREDGRGIATMEDAPPELAKTLQVVGPVRLKLEQLAYTYAIRDKHVEAVRDLDLAIREGEIAMLVGPSGCGKTTLLRLVAGLLHPSRGRILLDDQEVTRPDGKIGLVFQSYTSYPWLSVYRNVEFGLRLRRPFKHAEVKQIVDHLLKAVGLEDFRDVYVSTLSGGMSQRVAIARALAVQPEVVLMDEPFGALDTQTRWKMQEFLLQLRKRFQMTVLFVTHDIEEAVFLGSKVLVCSGRPLRPARVFRIPFRWEERTPELKGQPDFIHLREQIRQVLERESQGYATEGASLESDE